MPYSLNRGCRLHLKWCVNLWNYGLFCTKPRREVIFEEPRTPCADHYDVVGGGINLEKEITAWRFLGRCSTELSLAYLVSGYCAGFINAFVFKEWREGTMSFPQSLSALFCAHPFLKCWPVASFLPRWHHCIIALKEIQFIVLDNWSALGTCEIWPCYWRPLSVNKDCREMFLYPFLQNPLQSKTSWITGIWSGYYWI